MARTWADIGTMPWSMWCKKVRRTHPLHKHHERQALPDARERSCRVAVPAEGNRLSTEAMLGVELPGSSRLREAALEKFIDGDSPDLNGYQKRSPFYGCGILSHGLNGRTNRSGEHRAAACRESTMRPPH